jgi:GntR family transcriptional repressor for pyruvate dehydrogenase complex
MLSDNERSGGRRQLVQSAAERLRELIYASPPNEHIGSLPEIAREFGVGIVTVQQAARILEHEGILEVRRGPGGGYFGRRPNLSDMERVLGAYIRSEPASWREVVDITSLLFNQLCATAARCGEPALRDELREIEVRIARCDDSRMLGPTEIELQNILFRMVDRPLFELLTRVALSFANDRQSEETFLSVFGLEQWKESRRQIINSILRQDPELAYFEANRLNRRVLSAVCDLDGY